MTRSSSSLEDMAAEDMILECQEITGVFNRWRTYTIQVVDRNFEVNGGEMLI